MKVLILNTSASGGGAAIAARRLCEALRAEGIDAKMLVREGKADPQQGIYVLRWPLWGRILFLIERLAVWFANRLSRRMLWYVDLACVGTDITRHPLFKEADVIHLHWVNHGLLSLRQLNRIVKSGKRVVWTMHDQWPYTAICHHSAPCEAYQTHCHHCPQLCYPGKADLSSRVFDRKKSIYSGSGLTLVGCSQWIASLAKKSELVEGLKITHIANPVPSTFSPMDRMEARKSWQLPLDKKILLFGACKVSDRRKGADYLIEACRDTLLHDTVVVIVGSNAQWMKPCFAQELYIIDYVESPSRMASLYAAADVYITPSLFENLPNTIAEAMSVGTPCVGFRTGGIPEMIDHQVNGFVADYRSTASLTQGILWTLEHKPRNAARAKAIEMFSPCRVAHQYIDLYEE